MNEEWLLIVKHDVREVICFVLLLKINKNNPRITPYEG